MSGRTMTEAQRRELTRLAGAWYLHGIPFQIGEALRRRGWAERETTHVSGFDVADQNGVFPQWHSDQPRAQHAWRITREGRAALAREADHG